MIKNILFLIRYSWGISKRRFAAAGIEMLLDTVEPFVLLVVPKYIIDQLTQGGTWEQILFSIGILIACMVLFRLLRIVLGVFLNMSVNRSDVKDGMSYADHFLRMDYDKLENGKIRDIQMQVSSNVRENIFIGAAQSLLTSLFTLVGYLHTKSNMNLGKRS